MADEKLLETLYSGIRHYEASGKPYKPKWDYKLYTWGYGTPYKKGMKLSKDEAERQMRAHVASKMEQVLKRFPHLDQPEHQGRLLALTDLTYNSGSGWMKKGLGRAIERGDWADAEKRFVQYNKVREKDGRYRPLEGLTHRRKWGASLMRGQFYDPSGGAGGATTVLAGGGGEFLEEEPKAPSPENFLKTKGFAPTNEPQPAETPPEPVQAPSESPLGLPTQTPQETPQTAPVAAVEGGEVSMPGASPENAAPSPNAGVGTTISPVETRRFEGQEMIRKSDEAIARMKHNTAEDYGILPSTGVFTPKDLKARQDLREQLAEARESDPFLKTITSYNMWRSNFSVDIIAQIEEYATINHQEDPDFTADLNPLDKIATEVGVDFTPDEYSYLGSAVNKEQYEWRLAALTARKKGEKDWAKAGPMATIVGTLLGLSADVVTSAAATALIAGGAGAGAAAVGAVAGGSASAIGRGIAKATGIIRQFRRTYRGQMLEGALGGAGELQIAHRSGLISQEDVYLYALLFGAGGPLAVGGLAKGGAAAIRVGKKTYNFGKAGFEAAKEKMLQNARKGVDPEAPPRVVRDDESELLFSDRSVPPKDVEVQTIQRRQPDVDNDHAQMLFRQDRDTIREAMNDLYQGSNLTQAKLDAIRRQSYANPTEFTAWFPTRTPKKGQPVLGYRTRSLAQKAYGKGAYTPVTVSKGADIIDATTKDLADFGRGEDVGVILRNPRAIQKAKGKKVYSPPADAPPAREVPVRALDLETGNDLTPEEAKGAFKQKQDVSEDIVSGSSAGAMAVRNDNLRVTGTTAKAAELMDEYIQQGFKEDQKLPQKWHSFLTSWFVGERLQNHPVKLVRALVAQSFTAARLGTEAARDALGPSDVSPWTMVKSKNNSHIGDREKSWHKNLKAFAKEIAESKNDKKWVDLYEAHVANTLKQSFWDRRLGRSPQHAKKLDGIQQKQLFAALTTHYARVKEDAGYYPTDIPASVKEYSELVQFNMKDSLKFAAEGPSQRDVGNYVAQEILENHRSAAYVPRIGDSNKIQNLVNKFDDPEVLTEAFYKVFKREKELDASSWAYDLSDQQLRELAEHFKKQYSNLGDSFDLNLEKTLDDITSPSALIHLRKVGVPEDILKKLKDKRLEAELTPSESMKRGPARPLKKRLSMDLTRPVHVYNKKTGLDEPISFSRDILTNDINVLHDSYVRTVNGWGALSGWKVKDPDTGIYVTGKWVEGEDGTMLWEGPQNQEDLDNLYQTLRDVQNSLGHAEVPDNAWNADHNASKLTEFLVNDLLGRPKGQALHSSINTMRNTASAMLLQNSAISMTPEVLMAAADSPTRFVREYMARFGAVDDMVDEVAKFSPEDKLTARRLLMSYGLTREFDMARINNRLDEPGEALSGGVMNMTRAEDLSRTAQGFILRTVSGISWMSDANRMAMMAAKLDQVTQWAQKYSTYDELPAGDREWLRHTMNPSEVSELLKFVRENVTPEKDGSFGVAEPHAASNEYLRNAIFAAEAVATRKIQDNKMFNSIKRVEESRWGRMAFMLSRFALGSIPNHLLRNAAEIKDVYKGMKALDVAGEADFQARAAARAKGAALGMELGVQFTGSVLGYMLLAEAGDFLYDADEAEARSEGRYDITSLIFAGIIRSPLFAGLPIGHDFLAGVITGSDQHSLSGYRSTGLSFSPTDMAIFEPISRAYKSGAAAYKMASDWDEADASTVKDALGIIGTSYAVHGIVQQGLMASGWESMEGKPMPDNLIQRILEDED